MIIKRNLLLRAKPENLKRLAKWLGIEDKELTHQQLVHFVDKKINKGQYFFDIC